MWLKDILTETTTKTTIRQELLCDICWVKWCFSVYSQLCLEMCLKNDVAFDGGTGLFCV